MAVNDTIAIEKLQGTQKQWFKLEGGTSFKNIGVIAEVGYSSSPNVEPTTKSTEMIQTGEITDGNRGVAYIRQDSYFSYEFITVG